MKKVALFLCVALIGTNLLAQSLCGTYKEVHNQLAEHGSQYNFDTHGGFDYRYWDDVGDWFGAGTVQFNKDSVYFFYEQVPEAYKGLQLIAEETDEGRSTFQIVNPIKSSPYWKCTYQLLQGDQVVLQNEVGHLGYFQQRLQKGQVIRIYGHMTDLGDDFYDPFQIEIKGKEKQFNCVISSAAIKRYAIFLSPTSEAYPFKLKKGDKLLGLKINGEWKWFRHTNQ